MTFKTKIIVASAIILGGVLPLFLFIYFYNNHSSDNDSVVIETEEVKLPYELQNKWLLPLDQIKAHDQYWLSPSFYYYAQTSESSIKGQAPESNFYLLTLDSISPTEWLLDVYDAMGSYRGELSISKIDDEHKVYKMELLAKEDSVAYRAFNRCYTVTEPGLEPVFFPKREYDLKYQMKLHPSFGVNRLHTLPPIYQYYSFYEARTAVYYGFDYPTSLEVIDVDGFIDYRNILYSDKGIYTTIKDIECVSEWPHTPDKLPLRYILQRLEHKEKDTSYYTYQLYVFAQIEGKYNVVLYQKFNQDKDTEIELDVYCSDNLDKPLLWLTTDSNLTQWKKHENYEEEFMTQGGFKIGIRYYHDGVENYRAIDYAMVINQEHRSTPTLQHMIGDIRWRMTKAYEDDSYVPVYSDTEWYVLGNGEDCYVPLETAFFDECVAQGMPEYVEEYERRMMEQAD